MRTRARRRWANVKKVFCALHESKVGEPHEQQKENLSTGKWNGRHKVLYPRYKKCNEQQECTAGERDEEKFV